MIPFEMGSHLKAEKWSEECRVAVWAEVEDAAVCEVWGAGYDFEGAAD